MEGRERLHVKAAHNLLISGPYRERLRVVDRQVRSQASCPPSPLRRRPSSMMAAISLS